MPKSAQSQNGSGTQAKIAEVDGAGVLTPADGRRLKQLFDQIVGLRREQRQLGSEISEIYKTAKGEGFSTASMRDALKLLEMDTAEATLRLDLDQIYWDIARGGQVRPAEAPVQPNSVAFADGKSDGVAGERARAHKWPNGVYGSPDYELGWDAGQRLRREASEKIDPPKPRRQRKKAAAVSKARKPRNGRARPAA